MEYKYLLCALCIFIFLGCGSDSTNKSLPKITKLEDGRYEVFEAKRNGKETGTLAKGFYEIKGDSVFTNLSKSLDSIASTFQFKNNLITHDNPNSLDFIVSKMTRDTLELNAEIKGFHFQISLGKPKPKVYEE